MLGCRVKSGFSPPGLDFLPMQKLQAGLCLSALNLVAYPCSFTVTEGYLQLLLTQSFPASFCGPSYVAGFWQKSPKLGISSCRHPPCAWDPPSVLMKGLYWQNSYVSCCGISCSLLSPCSSALGCWELFSGIWGGEEGVEFGLCFLADQVSCSEQLVWRTDLNDAGVLLHITLEEMWKIISFTYQESILLLSRLMGKLQFI